MIKHTRILWVCLVFGLLLLGAACSAAPEEVVAPASSTPSPPKKLPPTYTPTAIPPTSTPEPTAAALPAGSCMAEEEYQFSLSIAYDYALPVEQITGWYCAGSQFEDILLALETVKDINVPLEELLERRQQGQSWDRIWKDIGLVPY